MKGGSIVLVILMGGQLVGAAVIAFLVGIANDHAKWARDEVWPWAVIAALGIACALCFLRGAFDLLGKPGIKRKKT